CRDLVAVPDRRAAEGAWAGDRLHLASPRRDLPDRRSGDRAPRRTGRRVGARLRDLARGCDRGDGRARDRGRDALAGSRRRRAGAVARGARTSNRRPARRRRLHRRGRRGGRPRRTDGQRTHRDPAGDLRRRPPRGGRDPAAWEAVLDPAAERCGAGRHRARTGGPAPAGARPRPLDRAQPAAPVAASARGFPRLRRRRRGPTDRRGDAAAPRDRRWLSLGARAPPLGRQPAEGRARQVARHRPGRAVARRADRRRRHRYEDRDPADDPCARGSGEGDRAGLLRGAGAARRRRPDPRRPRRRRGAQRRPARPHRRGRARRAPAGGHMTARLRAFDWRLYVIYLVFSVIFLVFALTLHDDGFLTHRNLLNVVEQTTMISIEAVAMTFVISAAEIDLSVGSVAGLVSVTTALALAHYGLGLGIVLGLLTGVGVGVVNGGLVAFL